MHPGTYLSPIAIRDVAKEINVKAVYKAPTLLI
jgi:hypothetical protein